jgi:hypothetical protein
MIRRPNFNDVTYDLPIDSFNLLVGNESGSDTKVVSLKDKLQELGLYLERDSVVLTSAQTCVLKADKQVEFSVQLYNYQSSSNQPAVLTIMATDKGTSIQTLGSFTEKLYFNHNGKSHLLKAERLADVREKRTGEKHEAVKKVSEMSSEEKRENVIMVFQVPLKVVKPRSVFTDSYKSFGMMKGGNCAEESDEEDSDSIEGACGLYGDSSDDDDAKMRPAMARMKATPKTRGVDMAVLSLGKEVGKYPELNKEKLVRDERFPIRCTFQYYRVSDDVNLEEAVIQDIKHTFDNLEKESIAFGSLVSNTTDRKTEPNLETRPEVKEIKPNWENKMPASFL